MAAADDELLARLQAATSGAQTTTRWGRVEHILFRLLSLMLESKQAPAAVMTTGVPRHRAAQVTGRLLLFAFDWVQLAALLLSAKLGWDFEFLQWVDLLSVAAWVHDTWLVAFGVAIGLEVVSLALAAWGMFSIHTGFSGSLWPIRVLRTLVTVLLTAGYVPLMAITLVPLSCEALADTLADSSVVCWSGLHAGLAGVALPVLVLFVGFALVMRAVFFHSRPNTPNIMAQPLARNQVLDTVLRLALVLLVQFLYRDNRGLLLGLVVLGLLAMTIVAVLYPSFYSHFMMELRASTYMVLLWIAIGAAVLHNTRGNTSDDGTTIAAAWLATIPLTVILAVLLVRWRVHCARKIGTKAAELRIAALEAGGDSDAGSVRSDGAVGSDDDISSGAEDDPRRTLIGDDTGSVASRSRLPFAGVSTSGTLDGESMGAVRSGHTAVTTTTLQLSHPRPVNGDSDLSNDSQLDQVPGRVTDSDGDLTDAHAAGSGTRASHSAHVAPQPIPALGPSHTFLGEGSVLTTTSFDDGDDGPGAGSSERKRAATIDVTAGSDGDRVDSSGSSPKGGGQSSPAAAHPEKSGSSPPNASNSGTAIIMANSAFSAHEEQSDRHRRPRGQRRIQHRHSVVRAARASFLRAGEVIESGPSAITPYSVAVTAPDILGGQIHNRESEDNTLGELLQPRPVPASLHDVLTRWYVSEMDIELMVRALMMVPTKHSLLLARILLEEALEVMPESVLVRVTLAAYIFAYSPPSEGVRAITLLATASQLPAPLDLRYGVFSESTELLHRHRVMQLGAGRAQSFDTLSMIEFKKKLREAERAMIAAVEESATFWTDTLASAKKRISATHGPHDGSSSDAASDSDSAAVMELANELETLHRASKHANHAETILLQMLDKHPSSVTLLRVYAVFLRNVRFKTDIADQFVHLSEERDDELLPAAQTRGDRSSYAGSVGPDKDSVASGTTIMTANGAVEAVRRLRQRHEQKLRRVMPIRKLVGSIKFGALGLVILIMGMFAAVMASVEMFRNGVVLMDRAGLRRKLTESTVHAARGLQLAALAGSEDTVSALRAHLTAEMQTLYTIHRFLHSPNAKFRDVGLDIDVSLQIYNSHVSPPEWRTEVTNLWVAGDTLIARASALATLTVDELVAAPTIREWRFVMDNAMQAILPAFDQATVMYEAEDMATLDTMIIATSSILAVKIVALIVSAYVSFGPALASLITAKAGLHSLMGEVPPMLARRMAKTSRRQRRWFARMESENLTIESLEPTHSAYHVLVEGHNASSKHSTSGAAGHHRRSSAAAAAAAAASAAAAAAGIGAGGGGATPDASADVIHVTTRHHPPHPLAWQQGPTSPPTEDPGAGPGIGLPPRHASTDSLTDETKEQPAFQVAPSPPSRERRTSIGNGVRFATVQPMPSDRSLNMSRLSDESAIAGGHSQTWGGHSHCTCNCWTLRTICTSRLINDPMLFRLALRLALAATVIFVLQVVIFIITNQFASEVASTKATGLNNAGRRRYMTRDLVNTVREIMIADGEIRTTAEHVQNYHTVLTSFQRIHDLLSSVDSGPDLEELFFGRSDAAFAPDIDASDITTYDNQGIDSLLRMYWDATSDLVAAYGNESIATPVGRNLTALMEDTRFAFVYEAERGALGAGLGAAVGLVREHEESRLDEFGTIVILITSVELVFLGITAWFVTTQLSTGLIEEAVKTHELRSLIPEEVQDRYPAFKAALRKNDMFSD